jgi:hypothetical protein
MENGEWKYKKNNDYDGTCNSWQPSFGMLSAAAEIFRNRSGYFPRLRKSSEIVWNVFRGRGNLQKSFGTFSAAAEIFRNRSERFPRLRKPSKIIWDVFRGCGNLQKSFGTFSAAAEIFSERSGHFPRLCIILK